MPFRLASDMHRVDDTPQHRAVREALTNALVHADYFGRTGVVLVRRPDRIIASNPGTLRISLDEVEAGGVSDPRNETLLSMFNLLNIGERAGSGYDTLREGTYSAGKPDPLLEELWEPDRVRLTLELETNGMAGFRLLGMGGETAPLVIDIEPPRSDQADVGNVGNVGNSDQADVVDDVDNVVNVVNAVVIPSHKLSDTERIVLEAILSNPEASARAIAESSGLSPRQVQRAEKSLREAGAIERIGGTRGYWKVKA